MRPTDLTLYRFPPTWRWLIERIWRVEHAFERAKAEGRAEDDTRLRIFFVLALFAAGFLTLAAGAVKSVLFSDVDRGGIAGGPPGERADLTDRNGQLLAVDLPHYGVYYDPKENWNPEEVRRALSVALPDLSPERLDRALRADKRQYLIGGLTPQEKNRVDDLGLPGVSFEPESKRVYLLGPTAGHLIGFVDRGGAGLSGAELALDDAIRSGAGKGPVPLSIDLRVQTALQDELRKAAVMHQAIGAVGLVTNVRTGEILGMASYPEFDPNAAGASPPANMVNHAAATVYEPGSVFKVFTLAMGLDACDVTPNTMFDARTPLALSGQVIHDYDKDNSMLPLWEVFTHSSNIGAARLGLRCGADRMSHYWRNFGLFDAAPSELQESAHPIVNKRMSDNVVASMAFGHAISVSPLAIATGMGAILNGGNYVPLTIRKLGPGDAPQGRRVIAESTSRTMLALMRLNVLSGTGTKADVPGYSVGGKTGSAEKAMGGHYERKKLVSSFAAVFPTDGAFDADRYFVLIMLDEPQPTKETYGFATGGWTAAPAAGRVIERIVPYLNVRRSPGPVIPFGPKAGEAAAALGEER
ncbi:MAG: penicillin-binding protein 2 [Caulobacteraceae bacterium]|nr:penicillin-binding protein 2 [Caulobacteraceae bacterium]